MGSEKTNVIEFPRYTGRHRYEPETPEGVGRHRAPEPPTYIGEIRETEEFLTEHFGSNAPASTLALAGIDKMNTAIAEIGVLAGQTKGQDSDS